MKTIALDEWIDEPHRNAITGKLVYVYSPRVRLLNPYTLVASRAAQAVANGRTHLASLVVEDGVTRLDPMTVCGMNTGSKPHAMRWVNGPTRIECKRCTTIALLKLGREGRLPGCSR